MCNLLKPLANGTAVNTSFLVVEILTSIRARDKSPSYTTYKDFRSP